MSWTNTLKEWWDMLEEFGYSFQPKDRPLVFLVGLVILYYFFDIISSALSALQLGVMASIVTTIGYVVLIVYILVWAEPLSESFPKKEEEKLNERGGL